ncbi:MAG: hypothetical protein AAGA03_13355, partial [Planctomycetota bacterium]
WRRGSEKPFRYASIDITTPEKQLDLSISKLNRQPDWEAMVAMNVNRWRGQVGLDASDEPWAGGEPISVSAVDEDAVWVDLVGTPGDSAGSMSAPFASRGAAGPASAPGASAAETSAALGASQPIKPSSSAEPSIEYDRPTGWRDGRMSMMRMAAFEVGPEDAEEKTEVTVITAGGDLRGNVARWIGQVRGDQPADEVVDEALKAAIQVEVDGKPGQRFILKPEDEPSETAIDATIVPLEGGFSLFIKMTGPSSVIDDENEALGRFIESIKL